MLTLEQLEQLEGRIVKALELISDLRVENSHLETEAERLKAGNDQLRLTVEEREREAQKAIAQLQEATQELGRLKSKEQELETRILSIIAKLDNLKSADKPSAASAGLPASVASVESGSGSGSHTGAGSVVAAGVIGAGVGAAAAASGQPEILNEKDEIIISDDDDEIILLEDEEEISVKNTETKSGAALTRDDSHGFNFRRTR